MASSILNVFKVWNCSRQKKKSVAANSITELREKAGEKLELEGDLTLVLEKDGTEIDDEEILLHFKDEVFMLLKPNQVWESGLKDSIVIQASDVWEQPEDKNEVSAAPQIQVPSIPSITAQTPLPNFSDYIQARLLNNDSHLVWHKFVEETAYYYLGKNPRIGKDNCSEPYKLIGQKMYMKYPSIERAGAHPWTFFTKSLSQKIRSIRFTENRKSHGMVSISERANPGEKVSSSKFNSGRVVANEMLETDEHYEEHIDALKKEFTKKQPDQIHMKQLMKMTYRNRREWIAKQPAGKFKHILDEFPWLGDKTFMMIEMKYILGVDHLSPHAERLTNLFEAVNMLKPGGKECETDLDVIRAIETGTGFKQGKGSKTKPIVSYHVDVQESDIEKVLSSKQMTPPSLVAVGMPNELDNVFIVGDDTRIALTTKSLMEALFILLTWYYITDLEYPRCFSQLLGFCQQLVLKQPFRCQKSAAFIHFQNKVEKALTTVTDQ